MKQMFTTLNKKVLFIIAFYFVFVMIFSYAVTKSLWLLFFGLFPYILGGEALAAFFVGLFIQRYGETKHIMGRMAYGILIAFIALAGCIITYGINESWHIVWQKVWNRDTYITTGLSFAGVMPGQFFDKL